MEKQTEQHAIQEAVRKCPYKKICQFFTKDEKEFILDQIDIQLDSYRNSRSKGKYLDFSGSFSEDMCDIKVMKSIYKKLNGVIREDAKGVENE